MRTLTEIALAAAKFRVDKHILVVCAIVLVSCGANGQPQTTSSAESDTVAFESASASISSITKAPTATIAPTSTSTFVPTPSPEPTVTPIPSEPTMNVHVMVDVSSESVDESRVRGIFGEADSILWGLAGVRFNVSGYEEIDLARRNLYTYVHGVLNDEPDRFQDVHYVVIFSYGDRDSARVYGGYSFAIPMPKPYRNPFRSPANSYWDGFLYGAVIHYGHRFAECGYEAAGDDEPVSEYSFGGECRNTTGLKCVQHFGYQACPNLLNTLYASTETYMTSSLIVHELGHSFGYHEAYDHFGATKCAEEDPRGVFTTLARAQEIAGMCPYVWDHLRDSFQGYK